VVLARRLRRGARKLRFAFEVFGGFFGKPGRSHLYWNVIGSFYPNVGRISSYLEASFFN
jgi:hypothetical protein